MTHSLSIHRFRLPILLAFTPLLLGHGESGCGCSGEEAKIEFGPPTETVCPPEGTQLTYDNFGEAFMEDYCLRCHSIDVEGADRQGAPSDHNFDTRLEVLALKEHIDWMTGAGPGAVNEQMPPSGNAPSLEERTQLSTWLACDTF